MLINITSLEEKVVAEHVRTATVFAVRKSRLRFRLVVTVLGLAIELEVEPILP
jgi:hypothetical protein